MEGSKKNIKVPQQFLRCWKFRLKKKGREKRDAYSPPFIFWKKKLSQQQLER